MAKRTLHLTRTAVEALPTPTGGPMYYADTGTPGLWLRVLPTGRRVFLFQRKLAGRKVRVTIGPYPAVLPEQARQEVLRMNAAAARGDDPGQARRQAREAPTFGSLFAQYLATYASEHHKDGGKEVERQFRVYLAPLAGKRMEELTLPMLTGLHTRLGKDHGPVMANRSMAMVRSVWQWGIRQELPGVPAANRGVKLTMYPEPERERFLTGAELNRLCKALDGELPVWRDFFMLCLLTGARRGNVAGMRWQDLDLAGGLWTIPSEASKNGAPMRVVLPASAVAILQARQAAARGEQVLHLYVFPSGHATGKVPLVSYPQRAWRRICERAELTDVHPHDLRRTMASWQAAAGSSLAIIGKSLGHKSLAATAIYARLDLDPVRTSVEQAAAAMLAAGRKADGA